MDRFIVVTFIINTTFHFNLKSNMDRFIVDKALAQLESISEFKIQYG